MKVVLYISIGYISPVIWTSGAFRQLIAGYALPHTIISTLIVPEWRVLP